MVDSTNVILPAAEAFTSGKLMVSEGLAAGSADAVLGWSDYPLNAALIAVFTLLVLVTLKRFVNIAHNLFDGLSRWKACLAIEASVQQMEDRNLIGYVCIIPISMIADRYGFITAGLASTVPAAWHCLVPIAAIAAWLFVKHLFYKLISLRVRHVETFRIAHKAFYNYWILASLLLVMTVGVLAFLETPAELGRKILLYELGGIYFIGIIRQSQILSSTYGAVATFLYLCALEFIPTAALIAGDILL